MFKLFVGRNQTECYGSDQRGSNLAATEEERNESELEEPVPKEKSKFLSLLEDVWEPEVRANPDECAKKEVKNIRV